MSDTVEDTSSETAATCEVCGATATPLATDSATQQMIAHLTDYNDPHHTLELIPKVYYGSAAPVVGDGYSAGDWYINTTNHSTYSYRKVTDNPATYQWVLCSPDMTSTLAKYVYVDPLIVNNVTQPTNLTTILASYLKATTAASTYATKTELQTLAGTVSGQGTTLGTAVYRTGSASVNRDLDSILSSYVTTSGLSALITGKQDKLVAGTNITINQSTNVISASAPTMSNATSSSAGLMSATDKTYLDSLPTALAALQTKLTQAANAGTGITISNAGVISATTYGNATTTTAGLMSASDKTKLDGISSSGYSYTLPAATNAALGGIRVATGSISDVAGTPATQSDPPAGTIIDVAGYTKLVIGSSGIGYSVNPAVASGSTAGVVKVDSTVLASTTGYAKCPVDANGFIYYRSGVSVMASSTTLGGILVDATTLTDTTGYSKIKLDGNGCAYYQNASVSAASSSEIGGVLVDATTLTLGQLSEWSKIRLDSDGFAYFRNNIASSSDLGHVKVSSTILSDTTGHSLCQVDSNGFIYAPATVPASSTALGGVMVDGTAVDSDAPGQYVKCRVDEDGVVYSKGYDTAIANLQYQGAGHDILVTAAIASNVVTLTNNAMNYVSITGSATLSLRFPERLTPSTNARDFFVVLAFGNTWQSSNTLTISGVTSPTAGETIQVFAATGEQMTFTGIAPGSTVIMYFTEITSGVFTVSRKTTARIF